MDGYLYFSNRAERIAVSDLPNNINEIAGEFNRVGFTAIACAGHDSVLFVNDVHCYQAAVLRWNSPLTNRTASVLFSSIGVRPRDAKPYWNPGWYSPTATESFAAWIFAENGYYGVLHMMPFSDNVLRRYIPAAGPDGAVVNNLRSSGNRLLFMQDGGGHGQDLWLWTLGESSPQPLVVEDYDQFSATIVGNTVVWTDARHGRGDVIDKDNPEIYWLDLTERIQHRLTNTSANPTLKGFPDANDDWIIWLDARNNTDSTGAPAPNAGDFRSVRRAELFGYHRPSGRMLPIYTGNVLAGPPRILGNYVYFDCALDAVSNRALYRIPLPTP